MKKLRPMPSPVPWPCVILAIDPGETSGWALVTFGQVIRLGECFSLDLTILTSICRGAIAHAADGRFPAVLVLERPFRGHDGASRTLWRRAWCDAGGSPSKIVQVYPATWRSQLFGRGAGSWTQAKARSHEQQYACALSRVELNSLGHDAAAAICIGAWASRAMVVGAKLPKRALKRMEQYAK